MMRTNIHIDRDLMKEAMAATGQTTMRATVAVALRRVVQLARQKAACEQLVGQGWDGDLPVMREGRDF